MSTMLNLQKKIKYHYISSKIGCLNIEKKINTPKYIIDLTKKYPSIASGRKNFNKQHIRIIETLKIIKKYFRNN